MSLPMSLLKARESVMRHFRSSLRDFNITEQQWRVLRALSSVENIEITDLANATCLLAPSLSRILRTLEQEDLITRTTVASDQRRSAIMITSKGMGVIEAVSPDSEAIYRQIAELYGTEKLAQLQFMLRELEDIMNAHNIKGVSNKTPDFGYHEE
ncbi:homoprotocatechuate degradation operon regulator HpaR [Brucellaceae bacterium C25G]